MKKEFYILKNRPKVTVRITRDSVCAGDDVDSPHEETKTVHSFLDPLILVSELYSGYLPGVSGVGHTWDCLLNGKIIASITNNGIDPKVSEIEWNENNQIHFVYHSSQH
nr:hypothetical protein [uncultured Desulfobacter sp.]